MVNPQHAVDGQSMIHLMAHNDVSAMDSSNTANEWSNDKWAIREGGDIPKGMREFVQFLPIDSNQDFGLWALAPSTFFPAMVECGVPRGNFGVSSG